MSLPRAQLAALTAALPALLLGLAPGAQAASQAFDVYAKENSLATFTGDATPLSTGLVFAAGDSVSISVTGVWDGGACGPVDADGTTCFGNDPFVGINYFSLIGKIANNAGPDSSWFKIGTGYSGTATSAGTLYLAFLDTDSFNNSGFVTATVTYTAPVPEPASLALMIGGLAALQRVLRRRVVA